MGVALFFNLPVREHAARQPSHTASVTRSASHNLSRNNTAEQMEWHCGARPTLAKTAFGQQLFQLWLRPAFALLWPRPALATTCFGHDQADFGHGQFWAFSRLRRRVGARRVGTPTGWGRKGWGPEGGTRNGQAFLLEMRTELFAQSSREDVATNQLQLPRTPRSFFENAVNHAFISADAMERGTFPCAKLVTASSRTFTSVLVHHDLEVFIIEPARPWRRTPWGCFEALQEFVTVQFQR